MKKPVEAQACYGNNERVRTSEDSTEVMEFHPSEVEGR